MQDEESNSVENPRLDTQSALTLIHSSFTSKANADDTRQCYAGLPSRRDTSRRKQLSKSKVLPVSTTDYTAVELKPRFNSAELEAQLAARVVRSTQRESLSNPIEFFEAKLYSLTRQYATALGNKAFSFACLNDLHHIYQLKRHETDLTPEERAALDLNLEFLLEEDPMVHEVYKAFMGLVALCSGLIVHWGLWSKYNYQYRTGERAVNVPLLDLSVLNEDVMTVETFWFCQAVRQPPLSDCLNEAVKQYAVVLESEASRFFAFLMRLNQGDFRQVPSLDGYFAARMPQYRARFHVEPDYTVSKPLYQALKRRRGCCHAGTQIERIRVQLSDLEFAYRSFERSLIGNMLAMRRPVSSH